MFPVKIRNRLYVYLCMCVMTGSFTSPGIDTNLNIGIVQLFLVFNPIDTYFRNVSSLLCTANCIDTDTICMN